MGRDQKRPGPGEKETEWRRFHALQAPGNSHCAPTALGASGRCKARAGGHERAEAGLVLWCLPGPLRFRALGERAKILHAQRCVDGLGDSRGRVAEELRRRKYPLRERDP